MINTLSNTKSNIAKDDSSKDNLGFSAEAIANEIMGDLDFDNDVTHSATMTISIGPANSDLLNEDEMNIEKIARFKRMIACGEYKIDHGAIAKALMASGDLSA